MSDATVFAHRKNQLRPTPGARRLASDAMMLPAGWHLPRRRIHPTQIPQPLLVVVTGRPGSGKTTLAHSLARAVRCPALCRDELKEGFVNTLGHVTDPPQDIQRQASETFFAAVQFLLAHQVTLVAEAAFQHRVWVPKLESLSEIARIRVIVCTVDPQLARARHIARGLADPDRERFHEDRPVKAAREGRELPIGTYDPPRVGAPTLTVDTSDGYDPEFEAIVSFARA